MATTPKDSWAQLLSLTVHELRTPASVVGGYLRMLQRDGESPLGDRQRKMVDEAERSCARLVAIIAELSDISKMDAGLLTMARAPFDLFPVIEQVADGVHEAEDRGVRLQVCGEATGAPVIGDLTRLQAAFAAIFRAILREKPSECVVAAERHVHLLADESSAIIVVGDEPSVQRSYERERLTSFDEQRGGLGLTLPLARRVIEAHGGAIWSPVGDGGRGVAIVSLPLSE